jgi:hypothetical protein
VFGMGCGGLDGLEECDVLHGSVLSYATATGQAHSTGFKSEIEM